MGIPRAVSNGGYASPSDGSGMSAYEADAWADLAADPKARVWLYGKDEARPGRKMGHVTRLQPLP